MQTIYRALSGQTLSHRELVAAGFFVIVWFLMDVIQFADFIIQKL